MCINDPCCMLPGQTAASSRLVDHAYHLSPQGRPAGMSGGIAYVLDESGEFTRNRCNRASVDLEEVDDPKDIENLRYWIARHAESTGSLRASGKVVDGDDP